MAGAWFWVGMYSQSIDMLARITKNNCDLCLCLGHFIFIDTLQWPILQIEWKKSLAIFEAIYG